jgi:hypothetical protein
MLVLVLPLVASGQLAESEKPKVGAPTVRAESAKAEGLLSKLPLEFEPNRGQFHNSSKFVARAGGYSVALSPSVARLEVQGSVRPPSRESPLEASDLRRAAVDIRLVGANAKAEMVAEDALPGKTNYFRGQDPKQWYTNVPHYLRVREKDAWPGIDMVYYGAGRKLLEYDIVVAPGADPSKAQLRFEGGSTPSVDKIGRLVVDTELGRVEWDKPVAYQMIGGVRKDVSSRYVLHDGMITFDVDSYEKSAQLIIDPVLVYSTFAGGSSSDLGQAIAIANGNVYFAGYSFSPDFQGSDPTYEGNSDIFVSEINSAGSGLVFTTFIGGSNQDQGMGLAVDPSGGIHIAGWTNSQDFPVVNAFQSSLAGRSGQDAVVIALGPGGNNIVYSTYLGGTNQDQALGIATDSSGAAYVTGWTNSGNFPTSTNSFQPDYGDNQDGFIVKLSAAGVPAYSSYLGRQSFDQANAVRVNASGEAYVAGQTCSPNLDTPGVVVTTAKAGFCAGFATKIAADGATKKWFTYIGDQVFALDLDASGNVYIASNNTRGLPDPNSPLVNPIQSTLAGAQDIYVAKLDPAAANVLFSTYLGGITLDQPFGLAVDGAGNMVVAGISQSPNFPVLNAIQPKNYGSFGDIVRSTDGGATWAVLNGPSSAPNSGFSGSSTGLWVAPNPSNGQEFYLQTFYGLFHSTDAGATWNLLANQPASAINGNTPNVLAVAASNPSIIYAATNAGVVLTTTGGASAWSASLSGLPGGFNWRSLAIDPTNSNIVYVGANNQNAGVYKTTTAGSSWSFAGNGISGNINCLVVDPAAPATIFACTTNGLYISTDSASTWNRSSNPTGGVSYLSFAASNPNIVYVSSGNGMWVSSNNGLTFSLAASVPAFVDAIGADPSTPTTAYAHISERGIWKSTDGGVTWVQTGTAGVEGLSFAQNFAFATGSGNTQAVLLSSGYSNDAFVAKISSSGTLMYSTFLGGFSADQANGVAVDSQNNAYIVGTTNSSSFPATPGSARSFFWGQDAFVAKISDGTPGSCTYNAYLDTNTFSVNGGNTDLKVITQPGCAWTLTGLPSWIVVDTTFTTGTGSGGAHLRVLGNFTANVTRTATLSVAGQTIPVTQLGSLTCSYAVAPNSLNLPPGATSGTINLLTESGCNWDISALPGWLHITPASGTGSATLTVTAAVNASNVSRSINVAVDGLTVGGNGAASFSVGQAGNCTTLVFPGASQSFPDVGGTGSFQVLVPTGCPWAVFPPFVSGSNAPWITFSPASGYNSATVSYTVAPNAQASARSFSYFGYTISQSATSCTYSLANAAGSAHVSITSPTVASADANGGTLSFAVTASAPGCSYPVTSGNFWPLVTSAPTATGSSTVNVLVEPNWNNYGRSATITAANKTFTINQSAGSGLYDNTAFVQQMYLDLLNQTADSAGLQYWVTQANQTSRAQTAYTFWNATDFPTNGGFVVQAYSTVLGRLPDLFGFQYWLSQVRAGQTQLQIVTQFVGSTEFQSTYGNLTDTQFVTLVYNNVLGRTPDPGGLAYWVNQLAPLPGGGGISRAQMMLGFILSSEYQTVSAPSVNMSLLMMGFWGISPLSDSGDYAYGVNFFQTGGTLQNGIALIITDSHYFARLQ